MLYANDKKSSFRQEVSSKFIPRSKNLKLVTSVEKSKDKSVEITKLLPPITVRHFKKVQKNKNKKSHCMPKY